MVGFDFNKVAELIHLPKDYAVAAMLVIGKGTQAAWPKPGFIPKSEMVIDNHFWYAQKRIINRSVVL